jgi:hypothetical protein
MTYISMNQSLLDVIGLPADLLGSAIMTLQEIPTPIYFDKYLDFWCECAEMQLEKKSKRQ